MREAYVERELLACECGLRNTMPVDEQFRRLREAGHAVPAVVDFLLVEVADLTRSGSWEEAGKRIEWLSRKLDGAGRPATYQLLFSRAFQSHAAARYLMAHEAFLVAAHFARSPMEKTFAELNALLSAENLGHDIRPAVDRLRREVEPYATEDWAKPVQAQLCDLRFRRALRMLDEPALRALEANIAPGSQLAFHFAWLARLPHFTFFEAPHAGAELALAARTEGYAVPYLLRTLSGHLPDEDLETEAPIPDRIERLYLWTWTWLVRPEPRLASRIASLSQRLLGAGRANLIAEDVAMLENALRWLALFSGRSTAAVGGLLRAVDSPLDHEARWLGYERLVLDYLFARRDGDGAGASAAWERLARHEAHACHHFELPKLVASIENGTDEPLERLGQLPGALAELLRPASADGLAVDCAMSRITVRRNGMVVREAISEPVAGLLAAAAARPCLAIEDALEAAFGITAYEPTDHDVKLAKLLLRAKQLAAPCFGAYRRGNFIHMSFPAGAPQLRSAGPHAGSLRHLKILGAPVGNISRTGRVGQARWLTRREIEQALSLSRATTLRKIGGWLRDRTLERTGRGKAARYRFLKEQVSVESPMKHVMGWILVLGITVASTVRAADVDRVVVKVESYPCASAQVPGLTRRGSGVLVEKGGEFFVVTSGHVPYHDPRGGNTPYCHRIASEEVGELRATFRAALFSQDLALLRVTPGDSREKLARAALPWAALTPPELARRDRVEVVGYPASAKAKDPASVYVGRVFNERSTLTSLELPHVVAIDGRSEFGQSGGGIFTRAGELIGLTSHQLLRTHLGRSATWEYRDGSFQLPDGQILTLAIPVAAVKAWWERIDANDATADIRLNGSDEGTRLSLTFERVRLDEINCKPIAIQRGAEPAPAGGGHGVGGGGGHGVGGGGSGDLTLPPAFVECAVAVKLVTDAGNRWPYRDRSGWQVLFDEASRGGTLYLNWLRKDDVTLTTDSLQTALKLMANGFAPRLSPTPPSTSAVRPNDLRARGEQLRAQSREWVEQNRSRFIALGAQFERMSPEQMRTGWRERSDAGERLFMYWIVRDLVKSADIRREILLLASRQAVEAMSAWIAASRAGQSVPAWHERDMYQRAWLIFGTQTLYDNWVALDASGRDRLWRDVLTTAEAKALLYESVEKHYRRDREVFDDVRARAQAYARSVVETWARGSDAARRAAWDAATPADRWWLFRGTEWEASSRPERHAEVRELNGGSQNMSLVEALPAI